MKKILSILSIALVAIIFAACSNNSPAGVVEEYYSCLQNGKYEKAIDCFHFKSDLEADQKKYLADILERTAERYNEKGGIASVKVTDVKMTESGEAATVSYTTTYGDGSTEDDNGKVIKVDGKWLLESGK